MINSKQFVSIVLPALNEAATLGSEIETIKKAMESSGYPYEIIVIDDGSTDNTSEVAVSHNVKLIKHEINLGVGASRKAGIKEAKGDIIATTDVDGTYPNERIPELLAYLPEYDMCIGARTGSIVEEPIYRRVPKFIIRKLASKLSGVEIPDLNSGLRILKKNLGMRYRPVLPNGHSWEGTITLASLCNGHPVKFIPISYYKRKGGKSSFRPIADTYSYIFLIVRTVMYFNPIRIFIPISMCLFLGGVVKVIYDWVIYKFIGGVDVVIFLSAIMVTVAGLLADLIVVLHRK